MVSDKEIKAAREAWREYWSDVIGQYEDNKGPMEGMRRALEAAARVRAEDNAAEPAPAVRPGAVKPLDEADYEDIVNAATTQMRKAKFGARGQMITVQDGLDWWIMKETESRILAALEPAEPVTDAEPVACVERESEQSTPQPESRLREALANLVQEIDDLVSESEGVAGLHLNGDVAEWGDLLPGGPYERLTSLDDARAALKEADDDRA